MIFVVYISCIWREGQHQRSWLSQNNHRVMRILGLPDEVKEQWSYCMPYVPSLSVCLNNVSNLLG